MRITRIELRRLALPLDPPFPAAWDPVPRRVFPATVVVVDTDEGLTGIGSGDSMDGFEQYAAMFVGEDPLRIARHVRVLETVAFHGGRPWPLEAALWDIAGKAAGLPVATLLGGAIDRLPAYASTGTWRPPAERVELARELAGQGFRAMKLRIDPWRLDEGIEVLRAVREAVPAMELIADLNQGWRMPGDVRPSLDVHAATTAARRLGELGVVWIEEPLQSSDVRGLASLRATGLARVAGGEMVRSMSELLALVDADALDVYQPDAVLAVGIARARTLAELVLSRGRWFTPHTWTNGVGLLANLHLVAGVGGGPFLEYPYDPPHWSLERRDFLLEQRIGIDAEGNVVVPDRPGLGVQLDEAAMERYRVG